MLTNQKLTCLLCGRDKFTNKSPHYCAGGYRKRKIKWGLKTNSGIWKPKTLKD